MSNHNIVFDTYFFVILYFKKMRIENIEERNKMLVNPLPDNKISDWSKSKQIANNILKCI